MSLGRQTKVRNPPKIYVAAVADDEAGVDRGRWIDASRGAEHINEQIAKVIERSTDPTASDWVILETENFEDIDIDEDELIERVARVAQLIVEFGALVKPIFDMYGMRWLDDVEQTLRERHGGGYASLADWAAEHMAELGLLEDVPEELLEYIDYQRWAEDKESGGDFFTVEVGDNVHLFWNR